MKAIRNFWNISIISSKWDTFKKSIFNNKLYCHIIILANLKIPNNFTFGDSCEHFIVTVQLSCNNSYQPKETETNLYFIIAVNNFSLMSNGSCRSSCQQKQTKTMQWRRRGVFLSCYGNRELKTLIKLTLVSLMKLLSSGLSHQWKSFV